MDTGTQLQFCSAACLHSCSDLPGTAGSTCFYVTVWSCRELPPHLDVFCHLDEHCSVAAAVACAAVIRTCSCLHTCALSPVPAVHGNTTSLVLVLSISWRHFLPAKCLLLPQGTGGRNIIPLLGCESCCFRSISSRSGSAAKLRQWAAVGDFHILFKNCDVEIASIVKCYDSSIW